MGSQDPSHRGGQALRACGYVDVRCEVHFQKENGAWRLDDEIVQVRFGE